jgi:hypothetical protein
VSFVDDPVTASYQSKTQAGADAEIGLNFGGVDHRPQFFEIRQSRVVERRFFDLHVEYLADKLRVQPQLKRMQEPALQNQRKLLHVRGIDQMTADRRQFGCGKLVLALAGNHAEVVGVLRVVLRRHADRERFAMHDVVIGIRGLSQRNGDARRRGATDASPSRRHDVRFSVNVVGSHDQNGRRIENRFRPKGFLHR